mmetsp:Transcript_27160/g.82365  ORF Transcript_27160/g.82365 Transcript_27160/m.82365 type:complete len:209 (+) Transcript_27160:443-1069(+)
MHATVPFTRDVAMMMHAHRPARERVGLQTYLKWKGLAMAASLASSNLWRHLYCPISCSKSVMLWSLSVASTMDLQNRCLDARPPAVGMSTRKGLRSSALRTQHGYESSDRAPQTVNGAPLSCLRHPRTTSLVVGELECVDSHCPAGKRQPPRRMSTPRGLIGLILLRVLNRRLEALHLAPLDVQIRVRLLPMLPPRFQFNDSPALIYP